MYVVRPIRAEELAALVRLARLSGPGFTSLPDDEEALAGRIEKSLDAFAGRSGKSGQYLMVLERVEDREICGCAAVKAGVGVDKPFFNYRVVTISQSSQAAQRRFDMDILVLVNEYTGDTEVGSLFVLPEARGGGVGRLIAQARYLLMAAEPQRFGETIVAELRGVVDDDGRSPFWEHLGRKFFQMDFDDADQLSATTDSQFILDLMPKHPVYVDLLAPEAQEVIGQPHRDGVGAMKLLEWEGFRYEHIVDIFDGGPLVEARRDEIRTIRESRQMKVASGRPGEMASRLLVSNDSIQNFAAAAAQGRVEGDVVVLATETLDGLGLVEGQTARIWEAHR